MENTRVRLNFIKTKAWYDVSQKHFEYWITKTNVSWRAIKPYMGDVMNKAKGFSA